jgi:hypothetical protein
MSASLYLFCKLLNQRSREVRVSDTLLTTGGNCQTIRALSSMPTGEKALNFK